MNSRRTAVDQVLLTGRSDASQGSMPEAVTEQWYYYAMHFPARDQIARHPLWNFWSRYYDLNRWAFTSAIRKLHKQCHPTALMYFIKLVYPMRRNTRRFRIVPCQRFPWKSISRRRKLKTTRNTAYTETDLLYMDAYVCVCVCNVITVHSASCLLNFPLRRTKFSSHDYSERIRKNEKIFIMTEESEEIRPLFRVKGSRLLFPKQISYAATVSQREESSFRVRLIRSSAHEMTVKHWVRPSFRDSNKWKTGGQITGTGRFTSSAVI